jgi:hypothetical protein
VGRILSLSHRHAIEIKRCHQSPIHDGALPSKGPKDTQTLAKPTPEKAETLYRHLSPSQ